MTRGPRGPRAGWPRVSRAHLASPVPQLCQELSLPHSLTPRCLKSPPLASGCPWPQLQMVCRQVKLLFLLSRALLCLLALAGHWQPRG